MNYELFPIPFSDINRPIYYMVKSFFSYDHGNCLSLDEMKRKWEEVKFDSTGGINLIFPSEDLTMSYDRFTLQREVIILKNCSIIHEDDSEVPPEAYFLDEVDLYIKTTYEPHEEHYYIDVNPANNEYRVVKERDTFEWNGGPQFFDNTVQFRRALEKMYSLLKEMESEDSSWTSRMKTSIKMVDTKVNELHIMHNAGLYDFHILERNLVNHCLDESKWRLEFNDYVSQLKIFAMYALNNLGWSMHGSGFGDDPESPRVVEMLKQERDRRKTMHF